MNLAAFTAWRTAIEVARDEPSHRRGYGARRLQLLSVSLGSRIIKNEI
jgi:hypothetical protein